MRHRLSGLSTYELKGQCAGDEHPAYASGHGPFTFALLLVVNCRKCRLTYLRQEGMQQSETVVLVSGNKGRYGSRKLVSDLYNLCNFVSIYSCLANVGNHYSDLLAMSLTHPDFSVRHCH